VVEVTDMLHRCRRAGRARFLPLLTLLGLAPACAGLTGCAETADDSGVLVSEFPVSVSPGLAPGLADGCGDDPKPFGRLRGVVYDIPTGTRILPDFSTLSPVETVCLDRLDVTPRRSVYPAFPGLKDRFKWFAVDLRGAFAVDEPGLFSFRLTSDDGAQLFVDDVLVVDNDGYHPPRMAFAAARIPAGRHTLRVAYWQGPGPLALMLEVARDGEGYQLLRMDRPL
jgi:hypothetical protein